MYEYEAGSAIVDGSWLNIHFDDEGDVIALRSSIPDLTPSMIAAARSEKQLTAADVLVLLRQIYKAILEDPVCGRMRKRAFQELERTINAGGLHHLWRKVLRSRSPHLVWDVKLDYDFVIDATTGSVLSQVNDGCLSCCVLDQFEEPPPSEPNDGERARAAAAAAATSANMIAVWGITSPPGTSGYVPIQIRSAHSAAGVNFDLTYPPAYISTPICTLDPALAATHSLATNVNLAPSKIRLAAYSLDGVPMRDGVLVVCQVQILPTAPRGTTFNILIDRITGADANGNKTLGWASQSGTFTIDDAVAQCSIGAKPSADAATLLFVLPPLLWRAARRLRGLGKVIGIALVAALLGTAQPAPAQVSGTMRLTARDQRSVETLATWFVTDVVQDGEKISGRVALVGMPGISIGRFAGRVRENGWVGGTITDESGRRYAIVRGELVSSGVEGIFRLRGGVPGEWEWTTDAPDFGELVRKRLASRKRR